MAILKLDLRLPQKLDWGSADPQPDWSFDSLLSELDSIDKKLNASSSDFLVPLTEKKSTDWKASKDGHHSTRGFIISVSDDFSDYSEDDDSEDEPCNDDSEDESDVDTQCHLMNKMALVEGALHELTHDLQLNVTEPVRSKISTFESDVIIEDEKFDSLLNKIEKQRKLQQERERNVDLQYQRMIAEALDNHLTDVQRDHEHVSQLEERRIRDDFAREEAKRKEKAIQEENLRKERMRAEEERIAAERAKAAAIEAERALAAQIEAERKAAEEAESKRASEASAKSVVWAKNALELERRRMQIYEELCARNNTIKASSNHNFNRHGQLMGRLIKTTSATAESISSKAEEFVKLLNHPEYPQSISLELFAEKIVAFCTSKKMFFATAHIIVLVASKVPQAMDILIAELNKACIYTVPKYISYSKAVFESKDAYVKAIGYEEDDDINSYVERLCCCMKLYGALVQTEIRGFENPHGLKEGWAWLARFLNALPANIYTAYALYSFLEVAGYALHRRYRNQFEKLMKIVARDFVPSLKDSGKESWSSKMNAVKVSMMNYLDTRMFEKEPQGFEIRQHLDSTVFGVF